MKKKYPRQRTIALSIGFIVTLFFLHTKNSWAQSKTKVWLNYNTFQDEALGLVNIQIQLAKWSYIATQKVKQDEIGLRVIEKANQLLDKDIVSLLQEAKKKEIALSEYIGQLEETSDQALVQEQVLQSKRQDAQAKQNECSQQKNLADQNFKLWMDEKNQAIVKQALEESQKFGSCQTQYQIVYNAYTILYNKLQERRKLLTNKKILLEWNYDIIVQNADLLENKTLMIEELLQLRNKLDNIQKQSKLLQ